MHRFMIVALGVIAALVVLPLAGMQMSRAQPAYAHEAFQEARDELDLPIDGGQVSRTWFWGPEPITEGIYEPYAESPGGERLVQYIDKARFELTNPNGDPKSPWFVTTGLLTRELISGSVQVGTASYVQRVPSDRAMAGDITNTWPTYAGFGSVIDQLHTDMTGEFATNVLLENGVSTYTDAMDDPGAELVQYLEYEGPDGPAGYNIPAAFWEFMHAPGITWDGVAYFPSAPLMDWLFVLGLPISDPYWVSVDLAGQPTWVMIQAFERRVLTYTPTNPDGWQVEMGNVGRHYAEWRHGDEPPDETPTPTEPVPTEPTPTEPTPTIPVPPPPPPVDHEPGQSSDFWAMRPGNIWAYLDEDAGEYYVVEITGRSTEFIEGEWLLMREETRPDGSREVSYWDSTENVLWLYGYEELDGEGNLETRVVYDPPVRYLTDYLEVGQGWGTNTWVKINGVQSRLVQFEFDVNMLRDFSTDAGTFEAHYITATETLTDGDELIGSPLSVRQFDFSPYYGIVREDRDGLELVLVAYSLN